MEPIHQFPHSHFLILWAKIYNSWFTLNLFLTWNYLLNFLRFPEYSWLMWQVYVYTFSLFLEALDPEKAVLVFDYFVLIFFNFLHLLYHNSISINFWVPVYIFFPEDLDSEKAIFVVDCYIFVSHVLYDMFFYAYSTTIMFPFIFSRNIKLLY